MNEDLSMNSLDDLEALYHFVSNTFNVRAGNIDEWNKWLEAIKRAIEKRKILEGIE